MNFNLGKEISMYKNGYSFGKVKNLKIIKSSKNKNIRAEFNLVNEINNTSIHHICLSDEYKKLKNKIVEDEILFIKFESFEQNRFDLDTEIIFHKTYTFVKDAMIITDKVIKEIFSEREETNDEK